MSNKFPVTNDVRQGAVSSPKLFSLYIDDLFDMLRSSGLSYRLNSVFYGCFDYANDLLLSSARTSGLQSMINTCAKFMNQNKC